MRYKHSWLFRDGEHAVENYRQRKELHKNLPMKFFYTFDTSRPDIQEQIEEIAELIRKETHE